MMRKASGRRSIGGGVIQCEAVALTGKRPSVPVTGGRSGDGPGGHRSVMGDSVMRMKR